MYNKLFSELFLKISYIFLLDFYLLNTFALKILSQIGTKYINLFKVGEFVFFKKNK